MNKFCKLFVVSSMCTVLACGCSLGGKKVTCSMEEGDDGLITRTEFTFSVKDGEVTQIKQTLTMDYSGADEDIRKEMNEEAKEYKEELTEEELCEDLKDCKGSVTFKDGKSLTMSATYKPDDTDEYKDKKADEIIEDISKTLESVGYTCK